MSRTRWDAATSGAVSLCFACVSHVSNETCFIVMRLMYMPAQNVENKNLNDYRGLTNIALGGFHAYMCNIWAVTNVTRYLVTSVSPITP